MAFGFVLTNITYIILRFLFTIFKIISNLYNNTYNFFNINMLCFGLKLRGLCIKCECKIRNNIPEIYVINAW
jgi:hypothetical protein